MKSMTFDEKRAEVERLLRLMLNEMPREEFGPGELAHGIPDTVKGARHSYRRAVVRAFWHVSSMPRLAEGIAEREAAER
jgi:hypothetical protein